MFYSVLFPDEASARKPRNREPLDCFRDMNLDQITRRVLQEKQAFALDEFFYTPLTDIRTVRYRQAVMRELADKEKRSAFESVLGQISFMRAIIDEVRPRLMDGDKINTDYLEMGRFLDTAITYLNTVTALNAMLGGMTLYSDGLKNFAAYLREYVASEKMREMTAWRDRIQENLKKIRFCMQIKADTIRVTPYNGQADYAQRVAELFARFRQGDVRNYRWNIDEKPQSEKIENEILKMAAKLYPKEFQDLSEFVRTYISFDDDTVLNFVREIQFYFGWLDLTDALREKEMPFCYPELREGTEAVAVYDCFDMALAIRSDKVVTNDFFLNAPEQIIVVSGPNQDGKSTFARSFGQAFYLAALGVCIPGREASIFLADNILTHFEREEDLTNLNSKLEDELLRLRDIMDQTTKRSVLVINEIFASTTLKDAMALGKKMLAGIIQKGGPSLIVTFLEELSEYGPETVSMVTSVTDDEKRKRTYKIVRKKADGLAYAMEVAGRHGLTYEKLKRRIGG